MHIVMVEASFPRGFDHLEEFVSAGYEVSFLTEDLRAHSRTQGFARHRLAARIIEVPSLKDPADVVARVRDSVGSRTPDGVVCVTDDHLVAAARLARDLGLPHEPVRTVRLLRDKAAVRRRLAEAGVGTLRWRSAKTVEEGLRAGAEIGYPAVVKPVAGRSSIGVTVVWGAEHAAGVLEQTLGAAGRQVLVEEFLAGRHVSAELLVQEERIEVLGFAERLPTRPDTTAELGGHFPAVFEQRGACRDFACRVVRALGVRTGALQIEMVVTPTGPELIEVNGRIAGHVVARQMSIALGRSVALDLAALAVGRPVPAASEPVSVLALRQLCSSSTGTVQDVRVPAEFPAAVIDCRLAVRAGDTVVPTRHNDQRLGYALAEGLNGEDAASAAEEALGRLQIRLAGGQGTVDAGAWTGSPGHAPAAETEGSAVCGPHVALLLDSEGPHPERILDALAAVTGRVSVLWCGPGPADAAVRNYWGSRYAGDWQETPGEDDAHDTLHVLRTTGQVDAVITFSAGLCRLRDDLDAVLRGKQETWSPDVSWPGERPGVPGYIVVSVLSGGAVRHVDVIDDLGTDDGGHRTLRSPSTLPEATLTALRAAAADAAARSGVTGGVVRSLFSSDEASGSPGPETVSLVPGLDEWTRAVYDAGHTRDLIATAAAAALGTVDDFATRRTGTAVLRGLAAPSAPFRVLRATPAAELADHPEVVHVHAALTDGSVRTGPDSPFWLTYSLRERDMEACRAAMDRVEAGTELRHTSLDRTHVLIIDRTGPATWTREDGTPLLPPDRFRVSVLSGDSSVTGPRAAPADVALHTDVFDHDAVGRLVRALHGAHPVHRIVSGSERLLAPAAALRGRLGLAGDSSRFVRNMLDKAQMKRIARRAGIRHAEGRVAYRPSDVYELLDRHGAVVLKPRELSGSQGVVICSDGEQAGEWLRAAFVPGRYLVERRVTGPMCHIDAVVYEGIVAWDVSVYRRDTLAYTRGRPLSSQTAGDPSLRDRAGALLESVVAAWEVQAGVLHLEAFVEEDGGLVFCEVAARPGGAGVISAFRATRGIDLRHAKTLIDAGEDPRRLAGEPVAAHAGWTVHYSLGGRLVEYDDSLVAGRAYDRTLNIGVGEEAVASAFSGTGLSTHVFAEESSAEVGRLVTSAEQHIHIRMEPSSSTAREGQVS